MAAYQTLIAAKAGTFIINELAEHYPVTITVAQQEQPADLIPEKRRDKIVEGMNPQIVGFVTVTTDDSDDSLDLLQKALGLDPPREDIRKRLRFEVYKYRKWFGSSKK